MYKQRKLLRATLLVSSVIGMSLTACNAQTGNSPINYVPVSYAELIKTPSAATTELQSINPEFERELIKVADNVHVAIGYGASVFSFIESEDGIIMIDTGQLPDVSALALQAYRQISNKPVKDIIFTHSHGDHINGASAFLSGENKPKIWGRDNFGGETAAFKNSGIKINRKRGVRQAGFQLPPEQRINNGIAPAVYPKKEAFNPSQAARPSKGVQGITEISIDGIKLVFGESDGETSDQIYIWYPEKGVIFAGDNFYQSWPNLYAIRGTPYRDIQAWAASIETIRALGAKTLVGGHTRPICGKENVDRALKTYHAGISYVFNKTIEGINKGLGPDALVEYAKLPPELANDRILRPFYGNPDWAVRAIFTGYLGWFDGNPTNLFPLPPSAEAAKMIDLAGGENAMLEQLKTAVEQSDDQWASQLADYILLVNPDNAEAMRLKADALIKLAERNFTATARNYYLTSAKELRVRADASKDSK